MTDEREDAAEDQADLSPVVPEGGTEGEEVEVAQEPEQVPEQPEEAGEQPEEAGEQPEEAGEQPEEAEEPVEAAEEAPAAPARQRGPVAEGRAYIKSTFNNTLISITDAQGNVLCWASGGTIGFQGTKKGTPFAAQMAAESAARQAMDLGISRVEVYVKGPGSGRETAMRSLQAAGLDIGNIKDVTPMPHNGCRPKKRRRM